MNFAGLAVTSPVSAASMVDALRWRVCIVANTPSSLARFHTELKSTNDRRLVVFCIGAHLLNKVTPHAKQVSCVFVFDDTANILSLAEQIPNFQILDVEENNGVRMPKPPTPQDINDALTNSKAGANEGLFVRVAQVLTARPPSILESTSRVPLTAPPTTVSGVQGIMVEIRHLLPEDSKVPFSAMLDYLTRLTFGITKRASVTANVTKKLPPEVSTLWSDALEVVCSPVGEQMARAYQWLCVNHAALPTVSSAISRFGIKLHEGDFAYLTAILPPSAMHAFVNPFDDTPANSAGVVKVSATAAPVAKSKAKKARPKR